MKRKFFSVLFALVLVLSMSMMTAGPALAATGVTNVWVQFTESTYNKTNTATDFTIHFTPTTAMSRGVDTITVWFPDGATAMGPAAFSLASAETTNTYYDVDRDGEATTYSAKDCTSAAVLSTTGYRITVTTPVDLDAGTACSLRIEAAAVVKCANDTSHSPYKVKVFTSKDTTPVLSDAFDIDATSPTSAVLALSPTTAGSAGQYTFTITIDPLVAAGGTVTVIFPYGTTVPSSISADHVRVSSDGGSVYETCTVAPVVNQKARMVTVTTPVQLDADGNNVVRFTTAANIKNPTIVKNSAYTDCYVSTSVDELFVAESDGYNVTAGTATKIGFNNDAYPASSYSDDATMINMYSSRLFVEVQDAYGNAKDPTTEPTVSFTSSQGSGIFYTNAETNGSGAFTQISSSATSSGKLTVYYRDTTAGTVTLTASATSYTSGTWSMVIAPGVSLYDGNNNLIKTYAATSTSPVAETGDGDPTTQKYSVDYINDAITAAVTGDTVKLGDGIYELDAAISLNKKITLTSVNGASSTTLRNTATTFDKGITVGISGTATDPVVIDGFTFQRLRSGVTFERAVWSDGYDYVTVQNCIFNYIEPDVQFDAATSGAVVYIGTRNVNADITSATVSNNTFNNCCTAWPDLGSGAKAAVIGFLSQTATYTITGVTVSGNTLTDCGGIGIGFSGYTSDGYVTGSITNNTITNGWSAIQIENYTKSVSVTGNTITNPYSYGVKVSGTTATSMVIKSNIITNTVGSGNGAGIRIQTVSGVVPVVQYNDITGSNTYAIKADSVAATSCQYNWFGSATGPDYTALAGANVTKSNPDGTGDKITDYVTYYPWLHKSKVDVVNDNASYQANTIKLVSGWNTLSTPVQLITAANSVDELIPAGLTIGYYYDGGWQQITTGYVLNACDAVYVKMGAVKYVLFKFDAGAFTMPSKDLVAGWNLASLASLSSMTEIAAVASVLKNSAGLPGYSQVISPSMNANQTDMLGASGSSWAYSSSQSTANSMLPGLGYWVYMQNAATLAGFEITPIAPDLD